MELPVHMFVVLEIAFFTYHHMYLCVGRFYKPYLVSIPTLSVLQVISRINTVNLILIIVTADFGLKGQFTSRREF